MTLTSLPVRLRVEHREHLGGMNEIVTYSRPYWTFRATNTSRGTEVREAIVPLFVPASGKRAPERSWHSDHLTLAFSRVATPRSRIRVLSSLDSRVRNTVARFRDAGTKVLSVHASRLAPSADASRQRTAPTSGASRTRRDGTPEGVTALSVARATDDRPEGECP